MSSCCRFKGSDEATQHGQYPVNNISSVCTVCISRQGERWSPLCCYYGNDDCLMNSTVLKCVIVCNTDCGYQLLVVFSKVNRFVSLYEETDKWLLFLMERV